MPKTLLLSVLLFLGSFFAGSVAAQDGKALFSTNCASCHAVHKKLTGPALAGVEERWPDRTKLNAWIKNSAAFLKTGDVYANNLYNEYNKTAMNQFPGLSDKDIDAILVYIKSVPVPGS
jgi:mono/diheme cytochrome c family protein